MGIELLLLSWPEAVTSPITTLAQWPGVEPLGGDLGLLCSFQLGARLLILNYGPGGQGQIFELSRTDPFLKPVREIALAPGYDIVEAVTLGNRPHLIAYKKQSGLMNVYPVDDDLTVQAPFPFFRGHEPAPTSGFTTLKGFTQEGAVVLLGYAEDNGRVAMYTLEVTATSNAGLPPLNILPAWSHVWAKGWTRFAFFQFGGENFFLKTNTWRPNVNIDHVRYRREDGTNEVATHMDLADAQTLALVAPFAIGEGHPHFAAYRPDGLITFYRVHPDGLGWTAIGDHQTHPAARQLLATRLGDQALVFIA